MGGETETEREQEKESGFTDSDGEGTSDGQVKIAFFQKFLKSALKPTITISPINCASKTLMINSRKIQNADNIQKDSTNLFDN